MLSEKDFRQLREGLAQAGMEELGYLEGLASAVATATEHQHGFCQRLNTANCTSAEPRKVPLLTSLNRCKMKVPRDSSQVQ